MDYEAALDNLVNKYELLGDARVIIEEDGLQRTIRLPLLQQKRGGDGMKLLKPSTLELYSFIFSMPLITVIMNLIMFEDRLWKDYRIWLFSVPLIFIIGICSWYLHMLYTITG